MKTLNLTAQINGLDGQPMKESPTLGKVLGSALVSGSKGDPIKYLDWALKLYNEGKIEVDDADFEAIKEFIKNNDGLTILAKGQLLKQMQ